MFQVVFRVVFQASVLISSRAVALPPHHSPLQPLLPLWCRVEPPLLRPPQYSRLLLLKDCCIEHEIRAVAQVEVAAVLGSPSHPQVEEVCGEASMIGQIRWHTALASGTQLCA